MAEVDPQYFKLSLK